MQQLIETGQIVNTHGIRGEIKVQPWADSPDFLLQFDSFLIEGKEYTVEKSRVNGSCVLIKLQGVDSIDDAQLFRGKTISFKRSQYTPKKGYFIADLIGLEVRSDGITIGTLKDVLQYPGNDVWVVKGKSEYLIPAVPAFIKEVNLSESYTEVLLLEGMSVDEN